MSSLFDTYSVKEQEAIRTLKEDFEIILNLRGITIEQITQKELDCLLAAYLKALFYG